jgi:predicted acyltransferase
MLNKRNISIDRYRGLIVFLMIFFQMLAHFENLGVLTHVSVHAPNFLIDAPGNIQKALDGIYFLPNMTLADIIAPAFMFAIGLTLISSYKRRIKTIISNSKSCIRYCIKI